MNWQKYWNLVALKALNPIDAVQRKDLKSTQTSAAYMIQLLKLNKNDKVLDICCGNGVLTSMVAVNCKKIVGVDQSINLIKKAKEQVVEKNVSFFQSDAMDMDKVLENLTFDAMYLAFSFQYFDGKGAGKKVVREAFKYLKNNGLLLISDIPDFDKKWQFYNTLPKKFYYITSKIRKKNTMGKFWKVSQLDQICNELNCTGTYIKQPEFLPYARYRFDYLIQKN